MARVLTNNYGIIEFKGVTDELQSQIDKLKSELLRIESMIASLGDRIHVLETSQKPQKPEVYLDYESEAD